jgi:hypothetical protein
MIDVTWHRDGHSILLELHKSELVVTMVRCPETGDCATEDTECLVRWYIDAFGLECNVGMCEAAPEIEIAWSFVGDRRNLLDAQVWIIPTSDYIFSAFADGEMVSPEVPDDTEVEEHEHDQEEEHTPLQQE